MFVKCACGHEDIRPLTAVEKHGPDLVSFSRRLRCTSCGAMPETVRLHRRVITVDGPDDLTGPIAGIYVPR